MSHEIETYDRVGIVGDRGWHGLGQIIQPGFSALDAANHLEMLEPVHQQPLFWQSADGSYHPVDTHVANIQSAAANGETVSNLLGIVGVDYSVCQNRELAEFTDALAQTGKVVIETLGTIRNGKRVWFLARGDSFNIGGSDTVHPYVLVSNAHDGGQAIRVTPTTVRVVCSNTLHMVVPRGECMTDAPETAAISIRHSGRLMDKLEQAKRAMEYYGATLARNRELFEMMQEKEFSAGQSMKLFADVYAANWEMATNDELNSSDVKVRRTAELRMARMAKASDAFLARYQSEQEKLGLGDTLWSAFNGLTGFIQHDRVARGSDDGVRVAKRIESNLFGMNALRTQQALAHALALAS